MSTMKKPTFPGSLNDLHRFRKTVHGHNGSSRIVMVRKTDQRTFASLRDGQEPTIETITRETVETFRGPRSACKITTEKKDCEEKVPPDIFESLRLRSRSSSKLDSKSTPVKSRYSIMDEFYKECLQKHNEYRKKHGVAALKLNKEICHDSQRWADQLIKQSALSHSNNDKYGENIFCIQSTNPDFTITGKEPVDSWYKEIEFHTFGVEPNSLKSGHFTQVVWRDSKELGIGYAKSGGRIVVVANYFPPGNYVGRYVENVPPLGSSPKQVEETNKEKSKPFLLDEFVKDCLNKHNEYRKRHGVAPLKLSKEICNDSQKWANNLVKQTVLSHSNNEKYGENIFCMKSTDPNFTIAGNEPVDSWYNEIEVHDFRVEPKSLDSGHFTQVIWRDSKELGIGYAKSGGKIIVVANYFPPGNYVGKYVTNVPPLGSTPEEVKEIARDIHKISLKGNDGAANVNVFENDFLRAHNKYRALHGIEPLEIDKKLCKYAQEWAKHLAVKNILDTRPNCNYGENIYKVSSNDPTFTLEGNVPVDKWYEESKKHIYDKEPHDLRTGHFTQMIWKSSTHLGVGIAKHLGSIIVVANYSPAGNFVGQFIENVPPPLRCSSVSPSQQEYNGAIHQGSSSSEEFSKFALEGLKMHNEFRRKHGVPEMKLNKQMCNYAQEWADICAKNGRMSHRPNGQYGENIFYSYSSDTSAVPSAREAVKAWYDEIKMHTFGVENMNTSTLHFTQVVWRESNELGIAMSKNRKGETYVVANYNPRGNFTGKFVNNVPRPRQ